MFAKYRSIFSSLVCLGVIYAPASNALVEEQSYWTTSDHCTSATGGTCYSEFADSRTFVSMTGELVTTTAWSNTENINGGSNNRLASAEVAQYGGGLGVRNADWNTSPGDPGENASPEHAIDNNDRFDMILFDFQGVSVALEEVYVGWYSNDADISVLAYTGNGPLNLDDREVDIDGEDLTANGWDIVGNYDVDSDNGGAGNNALIQEGVAEEDKVRSSFWLISAYNPIFASAGCATGNNCNFPEWADNFKIKDLITSTNDTPPPPTSVPAPGSLLLLATALMFARKRRTHTV